MATTPETVQRAELIDLFLLRRALARMGESDWFSWWESHALSPGGRYAVERIFRRTPTLSAAHLSLATARSRHDAAVPREPLVHLFNFGEEFEGEFDRWLVGQKGEGWNPPDAPDPTAEQLKSVALALLAAGITPLEELPPGEKVLVIGATSSGAMQNSDHRLQVARHLAAAYSGSAPSSLRIPIYRLKP